MRHHRQGMTVAGPIVMFVVEDSAISPDSAGGASAIYYSHLDLLAHSTPQITIELVITSPDGQPHQFERFEREQPQVGARIRNWCRSQHVLNLDRCRRPPAPMLNLVRGVMKPSSLFQHFGRSTRNRFHTLVSEARPSLIWAEHLESASLVCESALTRPTIYSHLDWSWRIKKLRSGARARSLRYRVRNWLLRRYENKLVTCFTGCISASASEAEEIRALGATRSLYLPPTYPLANDQQGDAGTRVRVVHLGGMNTTANRIGLERFLLVTWPIICREITDPPELWIVGSLEGAPDDLRALLQESKAVCTGFVTDLSRVLRNRDIHIIPWEYNTGTRTRIPLILKFGQVLVSTCSAAACMPELVHGKNCILVDDLASMADAVVSLCRDDGRRSELARNGRSTFVASFTREAVQPKFDAFLESVLSYG